ncbi:MAG: PAS domain S-box protein [Haloferacaceae archaeon]
MVDNPFAAAATARALESGSDGVEAATALTPREALDRLDRGSFDCVVVADEAVETGGIEFYETARDRGHDLPLVLFAGPESEVTARDALAAGIARYVTEDRAEYAALGARVERLAERYRTRVALEESRTRLSRYVEQSPLGVLEFDESFAVVAANPAAEEILGYDESELVGRPWTSLAGGDGRERLERVETALARDEGGRHSHAEAVRADGSLIACEWHTSVLTDDDGEVVAARSRFQDVTDRERRVEELNRKTERLEEFASLVSHDLRNPLSVAEGRLELARQRDDDDHLAAISRAHDRMRRLIDDLLTLAQTERAVESTSPQPLAGVAEAAWANVDTAGATLEVETDRSVSADRGRLQRLFENLVRNAVEHGGETVTVAVETLPDGQGFAVADDGAGVPPGEREAVFETGYSTDDDGTGFGLQIVERVAAAHGWRVELTESADGGARFEFRGVTVADE